MISSILISCIYFLSYYLVFVNGSLGTDIDNWVESSSPAESWVSIAMSESGVYAAAATASGEIYLSSDFGSTWAISSASSTDGWIQIVSSESGEILAAIDDATSYNSIYISTNYGGEWTALTTTPTVYKWTCITISGSGQYLAAGTSQYDRQSGGGIYISSDTGSTWTLTTAPSSNISWTSITSSKSFQYIVATESTLDNGEISLPSNAYVSKDYGESFSPSASPLISTESFVFGPVVSSYDGEFLFTIISSNSIYLSLDYGYNWTLGTINDKPWKSLAASDSGKYVAASDEEYIYLSSDFGVTWNPQTIDTTGKGIGWLPLAMNSSGSFIIAGQATDGKIYLGSGNVSDLITSEPTYSPTSLPTVTSEPTSHPTARPTAYPTSYPTSAPSITFDPTSHPTARPTAYPTAIPTSSPTSVPSISMDPTSHPTSHPTSRPTAIPTSSPTAVPTASPTSYPSISMNPTSHPTAVPTARPSARPTASPTARPTTTPTRRPISSEYPTAYPTSHPTSSPTAPTSNPTSSYPTSYPTSSPSILLTPPTSFSPTLSPVESFIVEFSAVQSVNGIALPDWDNLTSQVFIVTVADVLDLSYSSVDITSIKNTSVLTTESLSQSSDSSDVVYVSYIVTTLTQSSVQLTYVSLTNTLSASVNDGNFTVILQDEAVLYDCASLYNATSDSVNILRNLSPTLSPTNSPSSSSSGLSSGEIAGIVISIVVVLGLAAHGVYRYNYQSKSVDSNLTETLSEQPSYYTGSQMNDNFGRPSVSKSKVNEPKSNEVKNPISATRESIHDQL